MFERDTVSVCVRAYVKDRKRRKKRKRKEKEKEREKGRRCVRVRHKESVCV